MAGTVRWLRGPIPELSMWPFAGHSRVMHFVISFLLSCARIDLIAERRDHKSSLFPFYVRFLDGIAR
jgi:hypothetical protein